MIYVAHQYVLLKRKLSPEGTIRKENNEDYGEEHLVPPETQGIRFDVAGEAARSCFARRQRGSSQRHSSRVDTRNGSTGRQERPGSSQEAERTAEVIPFRQALGVRSARTARTSQRRSLPPSG